MEMLMNFIQLWRVINNVLIVFFTTREMDNYWTLKMHNAFEFVNCHSKFPIATIQTMCISPLSLISYNEIFRYDYVKWDARKATTWRHFFNSLYIE